MDALLESGGLRGSTRRVGSSRLILIETESVEKLKRQLDRALYRREVEERLGLSAKAVEKLAVAGLIRPLRGPAVDGNSDWRIAPEEVNALLQAFANRVKPRTIVASRWQ